MANQFILKSARHGSKSLGKYMLVPAASPGIFSFLGPLSGLLFSPMRLLTRLLFLPLSLFALPARAASSGIFGGMGKMLALGVVAVLFFDRAILDAKIPQWQLVLGIPALLFAVLALAGSIFHSLRIIGVSAFWFASTIFLGQAILGPQEPQAQNGMRYVQGDREYFVFDENYGRQAGLTRAGYIEQLQDSVSGVGRSVTTAVGDVATGVADGISSAAGTVQRSVSDGVSEVLTTLNLNGTGVGSDIMGAVSFNSGGGLPDAAFFPPSGNLKGRKFYPMGGGSRGGDLIGQLQGILSR